MTFKDLRTQLNKLKSPEHQKEKEGPKYTSALDRLKNKLFWIWNNLDEHKKQNYLQKGDCCFNHIVGCPTKDGIEKPMYDYEKILFDSLFVPTMHISYINHRDKNGNNITTLVQNHEVETEDYGFKHKHLWVKKATGLGVTEFFLRLMAWLCVKDDHFKDSQMVIVTGPNIDLAIKLIKRLKQIFEPKLNLTFSSKETVLELNGCTIEAYPSNHLDSFRSLANPKFLLLDELDFIRKGEQEDIRHVSERYIGKSDPYLVMVSTPNAPGGLFDSIEKEPEAICIYKRLKMDYTYGLDKIYTRDEIEKAKKSPSFEREYNLKYLGLIGNTFHTLDIDRAVELGIKSLSQANIHTQMIHGFRSWLGFFCF